MTTLDTKPNPFAVATHIARDIKLTHTVFAMPFALLGAFLAAGWAGRLPHVGEFALVVLCMVLARTVAMTVNRWADAALDASNPRTAGRAVPGGRVSRGTMFVASVWCAMGFVGAAALFWVCYGNAWPLILSPAVLVVLCGYSFTKRFTWLCHVFLGLALAVSPVAAAIAVEPKAVFGAGGACFPPYGWAPSIWLLSAMVLCWVAGFDVIYALQDVEHDRSQELFSMPSRLGVGPALWVSRAMHVLAIAALAGAWWVSDQLGVFFGVALLLAVALLVTEHALVWGAREGRPRHLNMAFFTVNGVISLLLGAAGILDVVRAVH